jgi:hypothetical protein
VAGALERRVRLTSGARHVLLQHAIGACSDWIAVAEDRQKRLVPAGEGGPGPAIRLARRIVGRDRDERRKLARSRLERLVGERCFVGRDRGFR